PDGHFLYTYDRGFVVIPAEKAGLEFFAGSEIPLLAVFHDEQMAVLVSAAIVRVEEMTIGQVIDRESALFGRVGQLFGWTAGDRDRIYVEDSALIVETENFFVIRREVRSADAHRLHELFDGVLLDGFAFF